MLKSYTLNSFIAVELQALGVNEAVFGSVYAQMGFSTVSYAAAATLWLAALAVATLLRRQAAPAL